MHYEYGGAAPARVGLNHPSISPYGVYEDGDGESVLISIQNEREWLSFCENILEMPDLAQQAEYANNIERVKNRIALDELINGVFSQSSTEDLTDRLKNARVAFGMLNDVEHLSNHAQLRRSSVMTESGEINLVASPVRVIETNGLEETSFGAVPALGEHNDSIRGEFS
jgi:itaconate CoA-transferase